MVIETKRDLFERVFFIDAGRIYNGIITKIEFKYECYFSAENTWRKDTPKINLRVNYNKGTSAEGECSTINFQHEHKVFSTKQEAGFALLRANGLDISLMEVK